MGNTFLARRDPLSTLSRWAQKYGDVIHYDFFGNPVYILAHPREVEQVLVARANIFVKGMTARSNPELFGNGLLTSDGDFWRRQRRLANFAFHRESILRYAGITLDEASSLMRRWQPGETRDVHQDMMNLTLRIALRSLFGTELGERAKPVQRALEAIVRTSSGIRAIASFLRIPSPSRHRYFLAIHDLDRIVYELIALGRERLARASDQDTPSDLLSLFLLARDDDGNAMTDQQLRDEVITLLLAGHETTALNLSWTWYLLATHPQIEQQLHAELHTVLGDRLPQPADLSKLPYADRVIRESLRLYPPAWRIWRTTTEPFQAANFLFPPGSNLVLCQWLTHRDPRWFPDPLRFHPDRWLDSSAASIPRFAYFPFGGGPRVCIGAGFAMMEATLLLVAIAQRFRLRLVPGQRIEPLPAITLRPKHGIRVEMQPQLGVCHPTL